MKEITIWNPPIEFQQRANFQIDAGMSHVFKLLTLLFFTPGDGRSQKDGVTERQISEYRQALKITQDEYERYSNLGADYKPSQIWDAMYRSVAGRHGRIITAGLITLHLLQINPEKGKHHNLSSASACVANINSINEKFTGKLWMMKERVNTGLSDEPKNIAKYWHEYSHVCHIAAAWTVLILNHQVVEPFECPNETHDRFLSTVLCCQDWLLKDNPKWAASLIEVRVTDYENALRYPPIPLSPTFREER